MTTDRFFLFAGYVDYGECSGICMDGYRGAFESVEAAKAAYPFKDYEWTEYDNLIGEIVTLREGALVKIWELAQDRDQYGTIIDRSKMPHWVEVL